jgi:hypothetical protein
VSRTHELTLVLQRIGDRYQGHWEGHGAGAGRPFDFVLPLQDGELPRLRWYLEVYHQKEASPAETDEAYAVRDGIKKWGALLHDAIFGPAAGAGVYEKLFPPPGSSLSPVLTLVSNEPTILGLPWEMLREGEHGRALALRGVTIRRKPHPNRNREPAILRLPLRVLLLSSRPRGLGRLDSRPTFAALMKLGDRVRLGYCDPPTLKQLRTTLQEAATAGFPYQVFHFDGHGDPPEGRRPGVLYFEGDQKKKDPVEGGRLGEALANYGVPLVILESCRGAPLADQPVYDSVAPALLECGVSSVVAFSHQVHVDASRLMVEALYKGLAEGRPIGEALAAGREALSDTDARAIGLTPEDTVPLWDWFVPQLYQAGELHPYSAAGPSGPCELTLRFTRPPPHFDRYDEHHLRAVVAAALELRRDEVEIRATACLEEGPNKGRPAR